MSLRYTLFPSVVLLVQASLFAQGETCGTAQAVDPGSFVADGPGSGGGATQNDAQNADWYAFTPATDGLMTVFSCGSQIDTRVHVHTGDCGDLTLAQSDDDGCPEGYPPGSSLLANFPVTAGTTYYLEWDDRYAQDGFGWQLLLHGCPIVIPVITPGEGSLSVNWTVLAPGTAFVVEYGPAGFVPGTGDTMNGVQGDVLPPVELTNLLENTAYDVYISVDCEVAGTAPFTGPWHGTTDGGPLTNDYCENAITITCGTTTMGSTIGAEEDPAPECGTSVSAPGVWYTFSGVSGSVVLSTCADHGYDTKINVYTGDCDDLHCVDGNDDGPFGCYPGSEVILTTDASTTYHVLVQGYDGATGAFGLSMDCPTCAPPTGIAITPADVQAFLYWTSMNTGGWYNVEFGPAGFALGTGTLITGIIGTDGPPVTIPGLATGTDYEAYLTEDCGGGGLSYTRGPIAFTTLDQALAPNAFCNSALDIVCGNDLSGDTELSVLTPSPACGSAYTEAPGLWYHITGDGSDVTLSTCDQADFDTKISVYSGTCLDPVCVTGDDDAFGCGANTSRVVFTAISGTEYLVLVHGYDGETGSFTLSMDCAPPCSPALANDDCATAEVLVPQPVGACIPVTGTNVCAYASAWPNPACDPWAVAADVWYALPTGPSSEHTLTVAALTIGTFGIALYTDCDPASFVECYDPQAGPIALTGLTTETTYYVRIWNSGGGEAGTFTICDEAELIDAVHEGDGATSTLRAWPVPVEDVLSVDGLAAGARTMRLLDVQGRELAHQRVERSGTQTINTASVAPGTYMLCVDGEETQVVRVVVR